MLGGRGRRSAVVMAIGRGKDPGALQGAPLMRWAKEWWNTTSGVLRLPGVFTPGQMVSYFQTVMMRYPVGGSFRRAVRGPVSGAIYAAERVRWEMRAANFVIDEDGQGASERGGRWVRLLVRDD